MLADPHHDQQNQCSLQFVHSFTIVCKIHSDMVFSHAEYRCHVHVRSDGLGCVIIADMDYPVRVAFTLINKVCLASFSQQYMDWGGGGTLYCSVSRFGK